MRLSLIAAKIALVATTLVMAAPVMADPFRFVAMGDLPYRLPEDYARFDTLIEHVNGIAPVFSIHVGDIKSGSTPCTDEAFEKVRAQFMTFAHPLFYTPGDNEWTDCHRKKAGRYDPRERLQKIREMFFASPQTLGAVALPYLRQSDRSAHTDMVENAMWRQDDVQFVTAHVVGSNNGLERNAASVAEYEARDAANQDWLKHAFRTARQTDAAAMVIVIHANLLFEVAKPWDYGNSGFKNTLQTLAEGAKTFGKPVLIVHGDHHELVIDQPLRDEKGKRVRNVTRLQVMGARDVGAVTVSVDTATRAVFAFTPMLVK